MYGTPKEKLYPSTQPRESLSMLKSPMAYVTLPNEQVCQNIVDRSVLIREFIDVISEATSYD